MALNENEPLLYEIVFAVEATSNLVAHWDEIKKHYIHPIVQYFHQESKNGDVFASLSNNLYGLVLFYAADKTPGSLTTCFPPLANSNKFLKLLDSIDFSGGGAEHHSFIAEGLATAAQLFDDMTLQQSKNGAEKFCFIVANTPPYEVLIEENSRFSGLDYQKMSEKLQNENVKISIICPHLVKKLKELYVTVNDIKPPIMNYAQEKRHLVLLNGFHLSLEKEPKPLLENVPQESTVVKVEPINSMEITPSVTVKNEPVSTSPSVKLETTHLLQTSNSTSFPSSNAISTNPITVGSNQIMHGSKGTVYSIVPQGRGQSSNNLQSIPITVSASTIVSPNPPQNPSKPIPTNPQISKTPQQFEDAQMEALKVLKYTLNQPDTSTELIWSGTLEWSEIRRPNGRTTHNVPCKILQLNNNLALVGRINASSWSNKLVIQLFPQALLNQGSQLQLQSYLKNVPQTILNFSPQHTQGMISSFSQKLLWGLIQHLSPQPNDGKIMAVFLRKKDERFYFMGLIPNDSSGFVSTLKLAIQSYKLKQGNSNTSQTIPSSATSDQSGQYSSPQFSNHFQHQEMVSQATVVQQQPQIPQINQPSINTGMNTINVTISTQPSHINPRPPTTQTIMPNTSSNTPIGLQKVFQIRHPATAAGNNIQNGARPGIINIGSMSNMNPSNRSIQQSNNQILPVGPSVVTGNRQSHLRTLLGPTTMQPNNMHLRQQEHVTMRPTVNSNMQQQQQPYMRTNNIIQGMPNQRNF